MSCMSENENLSDPYIEKLRQKYLVEGNKSYTNYDQATGMSYVDDHLGSMNIPPNSSLTESECKHYNRAMRELTKGLEIGKRDMMESLAEYEKIMDSSSTSSRQYTNDKGKKVKGHVQTSSSSTFDKLTNTKSGNDTLTRSTTLPTLPSSGIGNSEATGIESIPKTFSTIAATVDDFPTHSTIQTLDGVVGAADIKAIYAELMGIYGKLQEERKRVIESQQIEERLEINLHERDAELVMREADLLEKEKQLLEREHALLAGEANFKKTHEIAARLEGVELEVQERLELIQQQHDLEVERLQSLFQEKNRECKRLKTSFDTVKAQNEEMRTKLDSICAESKKVQVQNTKLKKRLENLQHRQDFKVMKQETASLCQRSRDNKENMATSVKLNKSNEKSDTQWGNMCEVLGIALDWISQVHLKNADNLQGKSAPKTQDSNTSAIYCNEYLTDKCLKVLPLLVDIIRILPSQMAYGKHVMSYLTFVYWSLCHLDDTQHTVLSSTGRRLGEELYRPGFSRGGSQNTTSAGFILATTLGSTVSSIENAGQESSLSVTKTQREVYFRSSCANVRLLSGIIILKTLHQVDTLAHVFGQLKKDLKNEVNRETFVQYKATHIVLPYVTYKANKALLTHAVDILLQMTMESPLLQTFLEQCSNESWFRAFSSVLRPPSSSSKSATPNIMTLEKLSIILQKLSKMKTNRKLFDAFSMSRNLQEWYRACDPQNTFLSLNLRSILFNLNLLKDGSLASSEAVLSGNW